MTSVPPATGTSEDATCEHALTKIWRGQARCTRCGAPARTAENDAPIADEWQCTCGDLNHPCEVHDTDADPRWNQ